MACANAHDSRSLRKTKMKYLLGTKENMTQLFDENGRVQPVTVISVSPTFVTQIKTKEKDGYDAVQIGFGERNEKNISKPVRGHLKGKNLETLREVRMSADAIDVKVGDEISADSFEKGEKVTVSSTSKGKGFQGVVKRHGFAGGRRTHGQKHSEREPGSIGATGPQRVFKGTRMAGRMGGSRVTVKNLVLVDVDKDSNKVFIKGAIPGRRGTLVEIKA